LPEVKKLAQLIIDQPDDMAGIDHHDPLHHVGEKHTEILLPLLALELAEQRADALQVAGDFVHPPRAPYIIGSGWRAFGQPGRQLDELAQGKPVPMPDVEPDQNDLRQLRPQQQHDEAMAGHP
jgi:hypothetical protein